MFTFKSKKVEITVDVAQIIKASAFLIFILL